MSVYASVFSHTYDCICQKDATRVNWFSRYTTGVQPVHVYTGLSLHCWVAVSQERAIDSAKEKKPGLANGRWERGGLKPETRRQREARGRYEFAAEEK